MSAAPVSHRYDFILVFDVQDGNPNGDPDAGNLPRLDPETGRGLVTDVCLKRKVRNYVLLKPELGNGYDIYVKERAVLGRAHFQAFQKLSIPTGDESRKAIAPEILELFGELDLPEGLRVEDGGEDGPLEIVVEPDADKKAVAAWLKEVAPPKSVAALIREALAEAKPRKPTREESDRGKDQMCKDYYDIRTFGAVLSLKSAPNCGQVRGPIQLTFGRSVDPIVVLEHSITRMAVATEAEAEKQGGDNRTMGRKNTVPYALYVAHGFVSAHLAAQTGFNLADLALFWEALKNMFEHDRSAGRGMMVARKLVVFEHASALGNAPAHQLFDRLRIERKDPSKPAREYGDYNVGLADGQPPVGVTIHDMI